MSKLRKVLLNSIMLVLCVLLFCVRVTGPLLHLTLGIVLIIIAGIHIHGHFKKVKFMERRVKVLDYALIVILVVMAVSGILLHGNKGNMLFMLGHKLSSLAFCIVTIMHVIWHNRSRRINR